MYTFSIQSIVQLPKHRVPLQATCKHPWVARSSSPWSRHWYRCAEAGASTFVSHPPVRRPCCGSTSQLPPSSETYEQFCFQVARALRGRQGMITQVSHSPLQSDQLLERFPRIEYFAVVVLDGLPLDQRVSWEVVQNITSF